MSVDASTSGMESLPISSTVTVQSTCRAFLIHLRETVGWYRKSEAQSALREYIA